jgi:hypothetical protein
MGIDRMVAPDVESGATRFIARLYYVITQHRRHATMIVRSKPTGDADLDQADQAWFESDAESNDQAIREIDAEAAKHGLIRTREYWLHTFKMPDGRVVRRGFCYRPEPWGLAEDTASRRGNEPQGQTAAEIVREMRG